MTRRSTPRGSPLNGVPSAPEMSQNMRAVASSEPRDGMSWNVSGSGWATMSSSAMRLKPSMDDPSKTMPFSNAASSSAGEIANDFSCPATSVNQSRTSRTPRSVTRRST